MKAWAVVLAGGKGTRFWPRSRSRLPKQCLALHGERTLLQQTVDRIAPIVPMAQVLVVTGPDMEEAVRAQLPEVPSSNILVEPRPRNTAPAIGWAAVEVLRRGGGTLAVLPSDHGIEDVVGFRRILGAAIEAAATRGRWVLLGQTPTSPHTGYGYLEVGSAVGRVAGQGFQAVSRFVEKPDRARAERMLADGNVLWNGGMFVFAAETLLDAYAVHLPLSHAALEALLRGIAVDQVWDGTDATSIDYGVLERLKPEERWVVPCDFGWSDLGSWTALEPLLPTTDFGVGRAEASVGIDSSGCIIDAPGKLVATLGVRDLVVVDTGDALLVTTRDSSQRIGEILEVLRVRQLGRWT